tara:strand:- start:1339 stop:1494 length:156 start_codon:yes stop_codon:yes gene_type:complete
MSLFYIKTHFYTVANIKVHQYNHYSRGDKIFMASEMKDHFDERKVNEKWIV